MAHHWNTRGRAIAMRILPAAHVTPAHSACADSNKPALQIRSGMTCDLHTIDSLTYDLIDLTNEIVAYIIAYRQQEAKKEK